MHEVLRGTFSVETPKIRSEKMERVSSQLWLVGNDTGDHNSTKKNASSGKQKQYEDS